ncbi:MAG TPA: hypothetical protein VMQ63_00295 [Stellaceae bacterium]|jgi:hypothetical protein|nr:hypothetical protein [Stellaceae bacterium]
MKYLAAIGMVLLLAACTVVNKDDTGANADKHLGRETGTGAGVGGAAIGGAFAP